MKTKPKPSFLIFFLCGWGRVAGEKEKEKEKENEKEKEKETRLAHKEKKKENGKPPRKTRIQKNKRKEMAEPGERPSITWGILLGCYALLFAALGVVLSRFFDVAYARAIGASMLLATGILAAPLVRLHGAVTV